MQTADGILKTHAIRNTDSREHVLDVFLSRGFALSQPDLEKELAPSIDRVTIYRTLSLFLDKGILHKVLDDSGTMKYALCADVCADHGHHHDHVHFKCTGCGHTTCLDSLVIPRFTLPEGYRLMESNLLLSGICPECAKGTMQRG